MEYIRAETNFNLFTMHTNHHSTNSPKTTKSVPTQIYILSLLKKHIRLGYAGIMDHSIDLSIPDLQKSIKKGMDRSNEKCKNYYINA